MSVVKCNGTRDCYPDHCDECSRFQHDCEGSDVFDDEGVTASNALKLSAGALDGLRDAIDEELSPDDKAEQRGEYYMECERNGD